MKCFQSKAFWYEFVLFRYGILCRATQSVEGGAYGSQNTNKKKSSSIITRTDKLTNWIKLSVSSKKKNEKHLIVTFYLFRVKWVEMSRGPHQNVGPFMNCKSFRKWHETHKKQKKNKNIEFHMNFMWTFPVFWNNNNFFCFVRQTKIISFQKHRTTKKKKSNSINNFCLAENQTSANHPNMFNILYNELNHDI